MSRRRRAGTYPTGSGLARSIRFWAVQGGGFGQLGPLDLQGIGRVRRPKPLFSRQLRQRHTGRDTWGRVSKSFCVKGIRPGRGKRIG